MSANTGDVNLSTRSWIMRIFTECKRHEMECFKRGKFMLKVFLLSLNINLFMELFQDDWFKTLNDKETKARNCHHEKLNIA